MLQIEHFTKEYGNKIAVNDLSLEIRSGEIFGFIGHNGAGKTTTIKAVAGILPFQKGEIRVDGISVREERIGKYGDLFGLTGDLGSTVSTYSHGMKQKLALIGALIHEPKLLLMDEPFVGLDPKAAHDLKMIMADICQKGGAIFFSTHVLEVAEKLCHKVAIIKEGKLADLVVLSENPCKADPMAIKDIQVLYTFKEGRCIFDAHYDK